MKQDNECQVMSSKAGIEKNEEEIKCFDLKSLYKEMNLQGHEANRQRWKGGVNSYSNEQLPNVFISYHVCFIGKGVLSSLSVFY